MPVIAFMVPVIMIFVGYSINVAYMANLLKKLALDVEKSKKK